MSSRSNNSDSDVEDFADLANSSCDEDETMSQMTNDHGTFQQDSFRNASNIPHSSQQNYSSQQNRQSSPNEINTKRDYLVKLQDLKARGVRLTGNYTMESNVDDLILEYDRHIKTKQKNNSLKFAKDGLSFAVMGMEMLAKVDPFSVGIDLEGFSDNTNPDNYEEILEELIEKYSSSTTSSPEMRLMWALGSSAALIHASNKMYKHNRKKTSKIETRNKARRLSSSSSISSGSIEMRKPDFSDFKIPPTVKFESKLPVSKEDRKEPDSGPDSDDESDEEEIITTRKNPNRVILSSSGESSDSGSSSDDEDEGDNINLKNLTRTSVGEPTRGRGRPRGSARGRGRGRGKNIINI